MFVSPMLLEKSPSPLGGLEYISELKLDGIRFILSTCGGIHSYTRHQTSCLSRFPELMELDLPPETVLDGEIICTDEKGHPCFESIIERFSMVNEKKIQALRKKLPVQYCVFDILRYRGVDVTRLPLLDRKALLQEAVKEQEHLCLLRWTEGQGEELFSLVCEQGLEGIVQKRKDSPYLVGKRSSHWLKVINWSYHDVVITGIRKNEFGWGIGVIEEGKVRPAGVIEFPPPPDVRKALWSIVPMAKIGEDKEWIQLRPEIRCRVKSRGFTKKGQIRLPVFQEFVFA